MAQQCEMIIGFLVPHRCEKLVLGHCAKCGRGYCEEHVQLQGSGLMCQACQQGFQQPVAVPQTAQTFSADDLLLFSAMSTLDDQDDNDAFSDLS
jgi:recombinational DNA repair protein (RecF pathway)